MALVQPGDVVFSYAAGKISAIGIATEKASTSSKPKEFGSAGDYWEDEGWFVPVDFKMLPNPIHPKDHWESLGPLMPEKYSPLNPQGNGLLLAPHVDHLFDKRFISFDKSGGLLISSILDHEVLILWKIDPKTNVGAFSQ